HSPDVMIAASGPEAIRQGDFMFILGEVHVTGNTLQASFAVSQHPQPEDLFVAIKRDLRQKRIIPVPPKQWPKLTNRTSVVLCSPDDYHIESGQNAFAAFPRSRVLPISALVVEHSPEGLMVCTRDRHLKFDIIHFFGELLSLHAVEFMKIMNPGAHNPRILIDRLVISRESWTFSPAE